MTSIRSDMPMTSGSSDDTIMTDEPACAEIPEDFIDLMLGPHINSSGRFDNTEDFRVGQQGPGKQNLLLVSTAEILDQLIHGRCFSLQLFVFSSTAARLSYLRLISPFIQVGIQIGYRCIFLDIHGSNNALFLPVRRDIVKTVSNSFPEPFHLQFPGR